MHRITIAAVPNVPMIKPGDDLVTIILDCLGEVGCELEDGDILVIAQKVVSKAEGRITCLSDVAPSKEAEELAAFTHKDPCLVEVILQESNELVRIRETLLIVEQKLGFICANAAVDRSNVSAGETGERPVTRLPLDPDGTARRISVGVADRTGKDVAVIINDTHGRPFRNGAVGVAIGVAGIKPVTDLRGRKDLFGYELRTTTVGTADEIASAASLLMGQADEGRPVILLRGVPYDRAEGSAKELLRAKEADVFRWPVK